MMSIWKSLIAAATSVLRGRPANDPTPTPTPLFCPRCNATWRDADTNCWNCNQPAGFTKSESDARAQEWIKQHINTSVFIKISVLNSGQLLADGIAISLEDLDVRLEEIKRQHGLVCYHREGMAAEMPTASREVLNLVIKYQLPISLASKPDFSDVIGSDQKVRTT